ncbi:hypothetical protein FHX42_005268 [Saccharopolyspora lacisalsi]|uniref:Uncharacterized protein n=1 Tax=Halosaccharopolyspora lacisalsi TaxID=1000566 RepID=A0A839E9C1_9PSEU|nr:hypothetical protein [Halosaccharopolyspora lacisalsi]MBA8827861.1 hypothetical protein [Halosaccharopolyspora lacisalsi]
MNSTARTPEPTITTFPTRRRRDEHDAAAMRDMEWRMESDENYYARRDRRTPRTVRTHVQGNRASWDFPTVDGGTLRVIARHMAPHADVTQYTFLVIPPGGTTRDGYRTLPGATRWSGATPIDGTPQGATGRHLDQPPELGAWISHLVAEQDYADAA